MDSNLDMSSNTLLAPRILEPQFCTQKPHGTCSRYFYDFACRSLYSFGISCYHDFHQIRLNYPVFYRQARIGRKGRKFIYVYKFRTMVQNADEILETYLIIHPN